MKKLISLLPVVLLFGACQTIHCSEPNADFWNHPRIRFREVLISQFPTRKPIVKKFSLHSKTQRLTVARPSVSQGYMFTQLSYGNSLNNRFNNATIPADSLSRPQPPLMTNPPQMSHPHSLMPLSSSTASENVVSSSEQSTEQLSGATDVPLTFPVPPPPEMVRQFHMTIQSSMAPNE